MKRIREESFNSNNVYRGIGEDSAAIFLNSPTDENVVLLTTDAINEQFSEKSPWSAGFSSILVGIEDIYACGGRPLAASSIISSENPKIREELLSGIIEATKKFRVPLVRGHTSDTTKNVGVSATLIGTIKREDHITAGGAKINDRIVVVADFDGKIGTANKYYWDTVTFRDAEEIVSKHKFMNQLAARHYVNASKDISNGGIFGTLLLMLEYSGIGAIIDIEKIKVPKLLQENGYTREDFSKMYLTTAYILSVPLAKLNDVKSLAEEFNLTFFELGETIESKNITLKFKEEQQKLWEFE